MEFYKLSNKTLNELGIPINWNLKLSRLIGRLSKTNSSMAKLIIDRMLKIRKEQFGNVEECRLSEYEKKLVLLGFEIARQYIAYHENDLFNDEYTTRRRKK